MAEIIKKATNRFSKGLVMDFSPENTKKEVLTHALNATLLTFNGNELSLQNDMGNARVETAYLPEGYIPVGTCEYGGIIYIVSYNPLEDKSQIGCFPSPERNISREELGRTDDVSIKYTDFQETNGGELTGNLKNTSCKVLLRDSNLNPGDKFIVYSDECIYQERLQDMQEWDGNEFTQVNHPMVTLHLVSIQDNGKIVYLNSDVRKYEVSKDNTKFKYHILGQQVDGNNNKIDVDSYRNVLSSGYSVFKEKTSGKLALLAELVTIDTFSLTQSIIQDVETKCKDSSGQDIDCYKFKVVLHPEVSPEVNKLNYLQVPKLKYWWANNTNGSISYFDENGNYTLGTYTDADLHLFDQSKKHIFNAPKESLHKDISIANLNWEFPGDQYYQQKQWPLLLRSGNYYSGLAKQFKHIDPNDIQVFIFAGSEIGSTPQDISEMSESTLVAVKPYKDIELYPDTFTIDFNYNYIAGFERPQYIPERISPMEVSPNTFLVDLTQYKYGDIEFASFQLPKSIVDAGIQFPFKYTYNITPCMEYGKLDFLSVSNEIDLKNLYNFKASNFTTWKYRVDDGQLMLTVGADVFDTFEQDKVDGLFLEFYDWRGFAGSVEISNKKSYSGKFTKIIPLNVLGALSTNRVSRINDEWSLTNTFTRNANIMRNSNSQFQYNKQLVTYVDDVHGWYDIVETNENATHIWDAETKCFVKSSESATHKLEKFSGENDCGVLYSNLIYGVKPYLRRTVNGKYEYIEKDNMFLFTMAVYNDYYYKVNNFNTIENPKLNLVLTYKLQDNGQIEAVNYAMLENGYKSQDIAKVKAYKKGMWEEESLSVTRYFKYYGTSKLNLQIGLQKEYESYNLSCSKDINKYFTCNLQLWDDQGNKGFSTLLDNVSHEIKYPSQDLKKQVYLQFDTNQDFPITSNFNQYGFIDQEEVNYIPINYSFIVDHTININNIRYQNIPTTTVCALFHKQSSGLYNYEDFNIYKKTQDDGSEVYLSDLIFYNSGNLSEQVFGVCRMTDPSQTTMYDQCSVTNTYSRSVIDISTPGILNAGDPTKQYVDLVGKLSFCAPYAAGLFSYTKLGFGSNADASKYINGTDDAVPTYTMVANTETMLFNNSRFIVVNGSLHELELHKYRGLNSEQLSKYNKQLLDYMKFVYAYNPDYDQLPFKLGDVSVSEYPLKFISHIISKNAKLSCELNDYLEMRGIIVKEYILDLNTYVTTYRDNAYVKQVQFKPDLTYCGEGDNPYLISSLTYTIEPSSQITQDLEVDLESSVVVKHHDGTNDIIKGSIDKNTLYTWLDHYESEKLTYPKLVQLDVDIMGSNVFVPTINSTLYRGSHFKKQTQETVIGEYVYDGMQYNKVDDVYLNHVIFSDVQDYQVKASIAFIPPIVDMSEQIYVTDKVTDYCLFDNVQLGDDFYSYYAFPFDQYCSQGVATVRVGSELQPSGGFTIEDFSWNKDIQMIFVPFALNLKEGRFVNKNNIPLLSNSQTSDENMTVKSILDDLLDNLRNMDNVGDVVAQCDRWFQEDREFGFRGVTIKTKTLPKANITQIESNDLHSMQIEIPKYTQFSKENWSGFATTKELESLYEGGIVLLKVQTNPTLNLTVSGQATIADDTTAVFHVDRTTSVGEIRQGYDSVADMDKYFYSPYETAFIGESIITVNDLLYRPETTGHRLFLRSDKFSYSGNTISFRKKSEDIGDLSKNTLRLFTGPGYNHNMATD